MSRSWTPKLLFNGAGFIFDKICGGISLILCTLLLSSCGMALDLFDRDKSSSKSAANSPLSSPPALEERPGNSTKSSGSLQPPRGVNTQLFADRIKDKDDRLDRLENAVQDLRNDFDTVAPAVERLSSVEGDIQQLVGQLEELLEQQTKPSPAPSRPQGAPTSLEPPSRPEPVMEKPERVEMREPVPKKAPSIAGQNVIAMRVGEHPDKTRIVLDVQGNPRYSADLDNAERILVVEMPATGWSATSSKSFNRSPLLKSYSTNALDGGGSRLIVQLKQGASIVYNSKIDGKQSGQRRIIIDLAADNSMAMTQ